MEYPPTLSENITIKFPVIRSVEISGYALFPGADQKGLGLTHDFAPGVTVIAGINGLGKTTLLNILLRLVIGPSDVPREDPGEVGSTRHEIISWQNPGYFSRRVPDRAASATVSGRISFGDETIYVTRSLNDLSLVELRRGTEKIDTDESGYRALVVTLSGVSNYYDFHFVVRNLLFYLEDRRPLLWSEDGQFEIARILFIPDKASSQLSVEYDRAKRLDSRYRNLLTETNRLVKRLAQQQRAEHLKGANVAKIATLKSDYLDSESALETIDSALETLIDEARSSGEELRRAQLDVEEELRRYEALQQVYYATAFPRATESFHYILAHLVSDGGCFICGSSAVAKAEELRMQATQGICPVCDSPPDAQERLGSATPVSAEQVNEGLIKLHASQQALEQAVQHAETSKKQVNSRFMERRRVAAKMEELRHQLSALGAQIPSSDISELETSVRVSQQNLAQLRKDRDEGIAHYSALINEASGRIQSVISDLRERFRNNVRHFLAEECELNYRTRSRSLGEGGERVVFPGFDVLMTSGVFRDQPRPRATVDEISESQKEFIDLAFRMALIQTATPENTGSMLILETPEASLDSLFVYRAGDLLRQFADGGGTVGNVLIASSNLSSANMIPALLGIDRNPEMASAVPSHVINLLDIAAPSRALVEERDAYDAQYRVAITPDEGRIPRSSRNDD